MSAAPHTWVCCAWCDARIGQFYFSVCYMTTNLMGLGKLSLQYHSCVAVLKRGTPLTEACGYRMSTAVFVVKWGDRLSFRSRIVTGFIIFLGCIIALPFITNMTLTLAIVCILGTSDAIVQGSIYGLSGQFHPRCASTTPPRLACAIPRVSPAAAWLTCSSHRGCDGGQRHRWACCVAAARDDQAHHPR